jgi:hypothetical protein
MSTSLSLSIKKLVPWYAKLGAKIVLSRIPVKYSIKSRFGIFRHGVMDDSNTPTASSGSITSDQGSAEWTGMDPAG